MAEIEGTAPLHIVPVGSLWPEPEVLWDWGDGTTEAGDSPKPHVYTEPGVYEVKRTITQRFEVEVLTPPDGGGCNGNGDPPPPGSTVGVIISRDEIMALPTSGPAWDSLEAASHASIASPDLSDQDDQTDVFAYAKALVAVRTGSASLRDDVVQGCLEAIGTEAGGRQLALGRNLASFVLAADIVGLPPDAESQFKSWLSTVHQETLDGRTLVSTHEDRPNNWGCHAGASRIARAVYMQDTEELTRAAQVFRGWLGQRSFYAGFTYGDLDWQANPATPVGINPVGARKNGHSIDGVLPDDQRRGGGFTWPPPKENYVYEALQGALLQAMLLHRRGFPAFEWSDKALLRAFQWLHNEADYPAEGDDTWQPWVVNHFYGSNFPARTPTTPGKGFGWTDWTLG